MRLLVAAAALFATVGLGACNPAAPSAQGTAGQGRYLGVGIYSPGESWTRMAAANAAPSTAAARTADDQAVIVVVDSRTGEIRGCGDMTGYCIGMNPWSKALTASQLAPINLTQHVKPPPAPPPAAGPDR